MSFRSDPVARRTPGRLRPVGAPGRLRRVGAPGALRAVGAGGRLRAVDGVAVVLTAVLAMRVLEPGALRTPRVREWSTIFGAVCLQALPYVVLGVLVGAAIRAVPAHRLRRMLPRRAALAVPVAALAGAALPGCECGSVPVAAGLLRQGVEPGPALAVMISAPAVNPVVLAATAAAFPGHPAFVLARAVASLAVAATVGWVWQLRGLPVRPRTHAHDHAGAVVLDELAGSIGLLTVGAAAVASLHVLAPGLLSQSGTVPGAGGFLLLAGLAVVLAVCSEADAVVAASFTGFSPAAQLAFVVVGPVVDVKLLALQAGTFGPRFAARFGLFAFVTALGCAALVARILL